MKELRHVSIKSINTLKKNVLENKFNSKKIIGKDFANLD